MLSICIALKNRSWVEVSGRRLNLFPNCVRSIVESVRDPNEFELVVADFESDDWPLNRWLLKAAAPLPVEILTLQGPFSPGRGRNAAAAHARGERLLFLDADALVSSEMIEAGLRHIEMGRAYFPVVFSYAAPDHADGNWSFGGYGQCMMKREHFDRSGGWPEFNSWGQEDEDFFKNVSLLVEVVREKAPRFYHQWHPNSLEWKNRYGSEPTRLGRYGEEMRQSCRELSEILSAGARFILVDESRFCISEPPLERSIPFLERNGVYWGLPPDNETAIGELNRLRSQGIKFIAFAWMAFWWLDFYDRFHEFLRKNSACVLRNDRLIVFELH